MSKTIAVAPLEGEHVPDYSELSNQELSSRIESLTTTLCRNLADLEPLVCEAWARLEKGETICGYTTKKDFAENVLGRRYRSVVFMLQGGNNYRAKEEQRNETVTCLSLINVSKQLTEFIQKKEFNQSNFNATVPLINALRDVANTAAEAKLHLERHAGRLLDETKQEVRKLSDEELVERGAAALDALAKEQQQPKKINKHLVGAQVGDDLCYNTSSGTYGAKIIALDDECVTIKTGKTEKSIHTLPLDIGCDIIRGNYSRRSEPELQEPITAESVKNLSDKELVERTIAGLDELNEAINNAETDDNPNLPPNTNESKEESTDKKPSRLVAVRKYCEEKLSNVGQVQGWTVNQCGADTKVRTGRFDLTLKGVSRCTIEKIVGALNA